MAVGTQDSLFSAHRHTRRFVSFISYHVRIIYLIPCPYHSSHAGYIDQIPSPLNILNWLREKRLLRVIKGESGTAFSSSSTFLCYVDPWTVTYMQDPVQVFLHYIPLFLSRTEYFFIQIASPHLTFATLGRYKYCPVQYENTNDVFIDRLGKYSTSRIIIFYNYLI